MKKNIKKIRLLTLALMLALMLLALPSCGSGGSAGSGDAPSEETKTVYSNEGLDLTIPEEYAGLLRIDTPQGQDGGTLFTVFEKASLEAAEADGLEADGMGWLFSIGRVDPEELEEMVTGDLSGFRLIGSDADGNFYVFYHPTDVRLYRSDSKEMEASMDQWAELTAWADTVPEGFLRENPGLTAAERGNADPGKDIAGIDSGDGVRYTITSGEFGSMKPGRVDPSPYVSQLTEDVIYKEIDLSDIPGGECVSLSFPDKAVRYDFFLLEGRENYVLQVQPDDEKLFRAEFEDEDLTASGVMQSWYYALAETEMGP